MKTVMKLEKPIGVDPKTTGVIRRYQDTDTYTKKMQKHRENPAMYKPRSKLSEKLS